MYGGGGGGEDVRYNFLKKQNLKKTVLSHKISILFLIIKGMSSSNPM